MTGLLPKQSDTAPVRGEEKNCRMEKTEPIRPKNNNNKIYIIRLAALILNTKTANLFHTYHSITSIKSTQLNVKQQLQRTALSLKLSHPQNTDLVLLFN